MHEDSATYRSQLPLLRRIHLHFARTQLTHARPYGAGRDANVDVLCPRVVPLSAVLLRSMIAGTEQAWLPGVF